jgi:GAF domain-containing protein
VNSGFRSGLFVPLLKDDEIVGTIALGRKQGVATKATENGDLYAAKIQDELCFQGREKPMAWTSQRLALFRQ